MYLGSMLKLWLTTQHLLPYTLYGLIPCQRTTALDMGLCVCLLTPLEPGLYVPHLRPLQGNPRDYRQSDELRAFPGLQGCPTFCSSC